MRRNGHNPTRRRHPGRPVTAGMLLLPLLFASGCAVTSMSVDPVYFPPPPARPRVVHLKSFNSLADLVPPRVSWTDIFRGRPLSPYVGTPAGIAFNDGNLYICDTDLNTVHRWNLATGEAKRLGQSGKLSLAKPVAVAVDNKGKAYVADTERGSVIGFDASGNAEGRYRPANRERYKPTAVALNGTRLYVADIAAHRIDAISIDDGTYAATFGQTGSGPGQFYFPMGVAAGPEGGLFVSDMMNARVEVFDSHHVFTLAMGGPGDRYGDMGKPRHLAVGPDGTVFIADSEFARIHLFNRKGQLLMLLGDGEDGPGGIPMPVGVAVAETLPDRLASLVPADFSADYFLFTTSSVGDKRMSLFAVGAGR